MRERERERERESGLSWKTNLLSKIIKTMQLVDCFSVLELIQSEYKLIMLI